MLSVWHVRVCMWPPFVFSAAQKYTVSCSVCFAFFASHMQGTPKYARNKKNKQNKMVLSNRRQRCTLLLGRRLLNVLDTFCRHFFQASMLFFFVERIKDTISRSRMRSIASSFGSCTCLYQVWSLSLVYCSFAASRRSYIKLMFDLILTKETYKVEMLNL